MVRLVTSMQMMFKLLHVVHQLTLFSSVDALNYELNRWCHQTDFFLIQLIGFGTKHQLLKLDLPLGLLINKSQKSAAVRRGPTL